MLCDQATTRWLAMIRSLSNDLLEPSSESGGLLGVHDLLLSELPHAGGGLRTQAVTLENLSEVRSQPQSFQQNLSQAYVDGLIREMEIAVTEIGSTAPLWLVECGSARTGRNLPGLLKAQSFFTGRMVIFTGCQPDDEASGSSETSEQLRDRLLLRLRFGQPLPTAGDARGESEASSKVTVGFAFIGLLELPPDPSSWDRAVLGGVAEAARASGAPVLVALQDMWGERPLAEAAHTALVDAMLTQEQGGEALKLVLCRLPPSLRYEAAYEALLARGVVLSFTFQGGIFYRRDEEDVRQQAPSDCEGAALVTALCRKGYAGQILLSQGVCCKVQHKKFGGHGLAHIMKNVVPRLKVSEADIALILKGTWARLLSWAVPPAPVEKAVEMGLCSLCGQAFEMRENCFYSKFQFVYCGSKCLRKHAQMGWKPL